MGRSQDGPVAVGQGEPGGVAVAALAAHVLAEAPLAATAQPLGGDGTDGTVETPCVGGYSDEMDAVWPKLSDDAKRNIIAADREYMGDI